MVNSSEGERAPQAAKKVYNQPTAEVYGSVEDITGSVGTSGKSDHSQSVKANHTAL